MFRTGLKTATGAAVLAITALLGGGIASADIAVTMDLTAKGTFPVIGELKPIKGHIVTTLPDPVTLGQSVSVPFSMAVDAPPDAGSGMNLIGADTIQGTVDATIILTDSAGTSTTIKVSLVVPSTKTPAEGQDLTFTSAGTVPFLVPTNAAKGPATVKIDPASISTTLDPKDSSGNDTALGTFNVPLTLDPAGQNTTLGTVQVN